MSNLSKKIAEIVKNTPKEANEIIKSRMEDFKKNNRYFSEIIFCILAANYTAQGAMRIQHSAEFEMLGKEQIREILRKHSHRFPNTRAEYIWEAARKKEKLKEIMEWEAESWEKREELSRTFKGIGMKEASHFLRNTGNFDVAILDRHILRIMEESGEYEKPKTMTRKRYIEAEELLKEASLGIKKEIGELDLYMWFHKTGKIMK